MKRILITRPRSQADDFAEKLRDAGFEPIFFPVIEIRPMEPNAELDQALKNLDRYDWVVFTSVNTVDVFFEHFVGAMHIVLAEYISPLPRVAAIGPKTAEALRKHDVEPDFIPNEYVGEAILSGLGNVKDKWILLPRAEIAREELPKSIVKAGGIAYEIVVYKTLPAEIDIDALSALKSGVDVITFTSASTVENFAAITRKNNLDLLNLPNNPIFACIGPVTEQAAKEEGLVNLVVAKEYTTDGLIEAISKMEIL